MHINNTILVPSGSLKKQRSFKPLFIPVVNHSVHELIVVVII
jgi:hypothetical protein